MSIKEFLGHCFCDSRFQQLRELIRTGTMDQVLNIQQLNNDLKRNHKHQEIKSLLEERLG